MAVAWPLQIDSEFTVTLGKELTVTLVVVIAVHDPTVAITVYVPLIEAVEEAIVGFWLNELKPPGPLHEYVAPPVADKLIVFPSQKGPVLLANAVGFWRTFTVVVPVPMQPEELVVTVYVVFVVGVATGFAQFVHDKPTAGDQLNVAPEATLSWVEFPEQTEAGLAVGVIVWFDTTVTEKQEGVTIPQGTTGETQIFPELVPIFTVIELVPKPPTIEEPAGTVQLYVVAPATDATEKVCCVPEHAGLVPITAPTFTIVLPTS